MGKEKLMRLLHSCTGSVETARNKEQRFWDNKEKHRQKDLGKHANKELYKFTLGDLIQRTVSKMNDTAGVIEFLVEHKKGFENIYWPWDIYGAIINLRERLDRLEKTLDEERKVKSG